MNVKAPITVYGKSIRENQVEEIRVTAINPDIRTFFTWYSSTVGYGNIGDNDINHSQARVSRRIRNLVDEMYKKAALWLARTFNIIIWSSFDSTWISQR
ncbi:12519_t:CDS:2 [Ambispora leptoticha]|uniref:12519_t:CDS:1 n=1 Tax=Ambispora leptoticha TaxID=144679 RepID=A0A9N9G346_9GLOM|nr:12519_t:CDS:2 [Ambispora leptoticha]